MIFETLFKRSLKSELKHSLKAFRKPISIMLDSEKIHKCHINAITLYYHYDRDVILMDFSITNPFANREWYFDIPLKNIIKHDKLKSFLKKFFYMHLRIDSKNSVDSGYIFELRYYNSIKKNPFYIRLTEKKFYYKHQSEMLSFKNILKIENSPI
jgi:hypothetical protein